MSGYRDETETLREELRRTSAELARANAELMKRESRKVEAIAFVDAYGLPEMWTAVALVVLIMGSIVCGSALESTRSSLVTGCLIAGLLSQVILGGYIVYRILPRAKADQ